MRPLWSVRDLAMTGLVSSTPVRVEVFLKVVPSRQKFVQLRNRPRTSVTEFTVPVSTETRELPVEIRTHLLL